MKITAIIAEYNPLHNGHVYHINMSKKITNADGIVCVMNGNFIQRGMPAVMDKWSRTKMALLSGVDLVIELPIIYGLSSAEFFSYGSISLLNSIGIIDNLCFGSECGNIDKLKKIAYVLKEEPESLKSDIKLLNKTGVSYPNSRSTALCKYFKDESIKEILSMPNNVLGIEYIKNILKLKSNMKIFTILRKGDNYNEQSIKNTFTSASAIRNEIKKSEDLECIKEYVPEHVFKIMTELKDDGYNFVNEESIFKYIKYKMLTQKNMLNNLPDVSEGLENKIEKSIKISKNYAELIDMIKSKRYTRTRICRILSQYFLGFENFNTEVLRRTPCPYAHVLGFNKKGTEILKEMKHKSNIPIYTKLPKLVNDILKLDIQSTAAYSILNNKIRFNSDYLISPICAQNF